MIRAIIIDDEADSIQATETAIQKYCSDVEVLKTCSSPFDGLDAIRHYKPDLVFLDIEMPGMSGFDLLLQVETLDFDIIFVTAYDQYAIKAIKFSALDYLLKPLDKDELQVAVKKLKDRLNREEGVFRRQSILNNIRFKNGNMDKIAVPSLKGIDFFSVADIVYCGSAGDYTNLVLVGKQTELVCRSLKDFEDILAPSGFCRVHHSYLINMRHIKKYIRGEGGEVILSDGYSIPVARRRKDEFLDLLNRV